MNNRRTHWLPVKDTVFTTIIGDVSKGIDWSEYWIDGPHVSMFNPNGGMYLHVKTKNDHWCIVRCSLAGDKYLDEEIVSIRIGFKHSQLYWVLTTSSQIGVM